ncbi:MAG: hypothetical protein NVS3B5_00290 [Sphingomicrobium sp.]
MTVSALATIPRRAGSILSLRPAAIVPRVKLLEAGANPRRKRWGRSCLRT